MVLRPFIIGEFPVRRAHHFPGIQNNFIIASFVIILQLSLRLTFKIKLKLKETVWSDFCVVFRTTDVPPSFLVSFLKYPENVFVRVESKHAIDRYAGVPFSPAKLVWNREFKQFLVIFTLKLTVVARSTQLIKVIWYLISYEFDVDQEKNFKLLRHFFLPRKSIGRKHVISDFRAKFGDVILSYFSSQSNCVISC